VTPEEIPAKLDMLFVFTDVVVPTAAEVATPVVVVVGQGSQMEPPKLVLGIVQVEADGDNGGRKGGPGHPSP